MKLKPILTEKSMLSAKNGTYTFYVPTNLNKHKIRQLISKAFGINVTKVRTSKTKAFVNLESGQTIDIFGEKKKKSRKSGSRSAGKKTKK